MTSVHSIAISPATLQTATLSWMAVLDGKDMFYMVCLQQEEDKEEFAFTLEEIHL